MLLKLLQILIILQIWLFREVYCVTFCQIDGSNQLIIPTSGCTLAESEQEIVVDKLIIGGELLIQDQNYLKYRSMQLLAGASMKIISNYKTIIIEDIGEDTCDLSNSSAVQTLKLQFQSNYRNTFYDIQSVSNQNELEIVNRIPLLLYKGAKVMIIYNEFIEYSEVEKVDGKKVTLKTKLTNNYFSYMAFLYEFSEIHPQLFFLDQSTIFFKGNCLNINPINSGIIDNYGAVFQDLKGINYINGSNNLKQVLFVKTNKLSQSSIFAYFRISCLNISNIVLMGDINQISLYNFSKLWLLTLIDNINIKLTLTYNSEILELTYLYAYRSNYTFLYEVKLKIFEFRLFKSTALFQSNKSNSGQIVFSVLQDSILKVDQKSFSAFTFKRSFLKKSTLDFSLSESIVEVTVASLHFEGLDVLYTILLSKKFQLLNIEKCNFYSFSQSKYPLIHVPDLIYQENETSFISKQKIRGNIYKIDVDQVNFVDCNPDLRLITLPRMAFTFERQYNTVTLNDDLYKNMPVQRIIKPWLINSPLYIIKLHSLYQRLYIMELGFTDQNLNKLFSMKVTAENGEGIFKLGEQFYLVSAFSYRIVISLNPGSIISNSSVELKLKTDFHLTEGVFAGLNIVIEPSPYAIKNISTNVPLSKYPQLSVNSFDKSIIIKQSLNPGLSYGNLDYEDMDVIFTIELCPSGLFQENGLCKNECEISSYIPFQGQCYKELFQDNYTYETTNSNSYQVRCPINCIKCSYSPTLSCSQCRYQYNQKVNKCRGYSWKEFILGESIQSCIQNCDICEKSNQCSKCIENYGLFSDACVLLPSGQTVFLIQVIQCPNNCSKCTHSRDCLVCNSGYTLTFGLCKKQCQNNQYFDSINLNCSNCGSTMETCGHSNIVCKGGNEYDPISRDCIKSSVTQQYQVCDQQVCFPCYQQQSCLQPYLQCEKGFFLSRLLNKCLPCKSNCDYCIDEFDNCIFCKEGEYYDAQKMQCLLCNPICKKCSDSKDKCISCLAGYFLNQTSCQLCDSNCKECIESKDKCTSCKAEANLVLVNTKCIIISCDKNYYLEGLECQKCKLGTFSNKGENKCTACNLSCESCSDAKDLCLTCKLGYALVNRSCQQCQSECKECIDSVDKCTSCTDINCVAKNNKCVVIECESGQYLEFGICKQCQVGEFSPKGANKCSLCDKSCEQCIDLYDKCISCSDKSSVLVDYKCTKCNATCQTCSGSINNCTSCSPGQFLTNNQCLECDLNCLTCVEKADKCTSCQDPKFEIKNERCVLIECNKGEYLDNSICKQCESGYYSNQGDNKCTKCDTPCKTCSDSKEKCTSCVDPTLIIKDQKCVSIQCEKGQYLDNLVCKQCESGYYSNQGDNKCTKCHATCQTCTDTQSNCTSCYSGKVLYNNKCQCDQYCLTCKDQIDKCLSCIDPNFIVQNHQCVLIECNKGEYLDNGECKKCQIGSYYEQKDNKCQKCETQCQSCTDSKDNCLSCHPGKVLKDNKCQCDQSCKDCIGRVDKCISCIDPNFELENYKCIQKTCGYGEYLDNGVCKPCQSGYFSLSGDNQCTKCDPVCKECKILKSFCLSCSSDDHELRDGQCITCDEQSIFENKKCKQCKQGEYAVKLENICKKCSENCKDCFKDADNCTLCNSEDLQLENGKCIKIEISEQEQIEQIIQEPALTDTDIMQIFIGCFFGSIFLGLTIVFFKNQYNSYIEKKNKKIKSHINTYEIQTFIQNSV